MNTKIKVNYKLLRIKKRDQYIEQVMKDHLNVYPFATKLILQIPLDYLVDKIYNEWAKDNIRYHNEIFQMRDIFEAQCYWDSVDMKQIQEMVQNMYNIQTIKGSKTVLNALLYMIISRTLIE